MSLIHNPRSPIHSLGSQSGGYGHNSVAHNPDLAACGLDLQLGGDFFYGSEHSSGWRRLAMWYVVKFEKFWVRTFLREIEFFG